MKIFTISDITSYEKHNITSIGLRTPKLEVFECNSNHIGTIISAKYVHSYTTEGWVKTPCSKNEYLKNKRFYYNNMFESLYEFEEVYERYEKRMGISDIFFTTLVFAKIAKMILLKRDVDYYLINDNTEKPLKEIKNEYPEYFI